MVGHQTKRMHLEVGFGTRFAERFQEVLAIGGIKEDVLPAFTATHHVVNGFRVFDSNLARLEQKA